MRLFRVELRRFWSRRLIRLLVVGVAVGIVIYGVVLFVTHSPERPSTEAQQAQIDEAVQECRRRSSDRNYKFELELIREQGEEEVARFLAQFPDVDAYADRICEPSHFGFYVPDPRFCLVDLWEKHLSYRDICPGGALDGPRVSFEGRVPFEGGFGPDSEPDQTVTWDGKTFQRNDSGNSGIVPGVSLALVMLSGLFGAAFVGAEYRAGTVETQLLWEPRRKRVLGAKLAAVGASTFMIHAALLALLVAVALPAAWWRGTTAGAGDAFWLGLGATIIRGGVISAVAAVIAAAVTAAARYTTAAVAVLLGYAITFEVRAALLRGFRPWDLIENAFAFANGGTAARYEFANQHGVWVEVADHGPALALVYVAVYTAFIVWVAATVFSRRDVT